ncbi:S-layer homology domain-containing protein, partial [Paenibacillus sp. Marseille-Q4541]|uniref:S-layer homology domain-containing protein n=1 Tax=Paenibacillus sp. Marseille-Q4541 TaxID=2831522 RepID=UPI001BA94737
YIISLLYYKKGLFMKTRKLSTASISILSTAALLGTLVSPAMASPTLSDVSNNYAKNAILELSEKGIMNGTGNGKFNPLGTIKRQDFAVVLAKALKLDLNAPPRSATFKDVPMDSYAFSAVEATHKAGLLNGMGNGIFGTGQTLTREQMAVIFVNALDIDITGKGENLTYTDSSLISNWAKDAVAAALENNIIIGKPNGKFDPKSSVIRQDVAFVTSKFLLKKDELDQIKDESKPIDPEPEVETEEEEKPSTSVTNPVSPPSTKPSVPDDQNPAPPINVAPTAKNLSFVFEDENSDVSVGKHVSIEFTYDDPENDLLESVKYTWYRSSDIEGNNKMLIPNIDANSYTFTADDIGYYISVEVTPTASTGTKIGQTVAKSLDQVVIQPLPVPDTTPPSVDITKYEVIDNYNGISDQISWLESAVSEENAMIRAYPWNDANNEGTIDDGELGEPIILGISNADGSVAAGNLGDLAPGEYKYVITATDEALNESEKNSDSAIVISLTKDGMPTVTSDVYGFDGAVLKVKEFAAGSSPFHIRFDYFMPEVFNNGTLEVTVEGISFGVEDYYHDGTKWKNFTEGLISNGGKTIVLSEISGRKVLSFELHNQVIPQEGTYLITFRADADGAGSGRTPSIEQSITLVSVTPGF